MLYIPIIRILDLVLNKVLHFISNWIKWANTSDYRVAIYILSGVAVVSDRE